MSAELNLLEMEAESVRLRAMSESLCTEAMTPDTDIGWSGIIEELIQFISVIAFGLSVGIWWAYGC